MSISTPPSGPVIPSFTMGDRLRKAREVTGLGASEFAEAIGVSRNTVTNYERDHVSPRRVVLNAWALRTGVPVVWLETGHTPEGDGPERPRQDSNLQPTVVRLRADRKAA